MVVLFLGATGVQAQESDLRWRWDLFFEEKLSYDSNVFRFSDDLLDRFDEDRPGDSVSGRFDDMDAEDDFVLSSSLKLVSKVSGIGDRLRIIPSIKYDYFTQNERKSHPTFGLSVDLDVGSGTEFDLDLAYELDAFSRNYLEDATDPTGEVEASERVYDSGVYDEAYARLTYRTRLWKRPKKTESFLDARRVEGFAKLGYARRVYDSPFSNRDRNSVNVVLGVSTEFGKRWKLDLAYDFDFVATDDGREVLIRDEADFGVDFNGDGDAVDVKRRTEQKVDRSHLDHAVNLRLRYDIAKRWKAWAGYQFRFQDYLSEERFDTHRGREDFRHRVNAGVGWEIDSRWSLELEGKWTMEEAEKNNFGDEDEETEYGRFLISIALILKFF